MTGEGYRDDKDKIRLELVPPEAIEAIGEVFTWACTKREPKYPPRNWEKGMDWERVIGSLQRHLVKFQKGIDRDEESGLPHLSHVLANAAILHTYFCRQIGRDNRAGKEPKPEYPGPFPADARIPGWQFQEWPPEPQEHSD